MGVRLFCCTGLLLCACGVNGVQSQWVHFGTNGTLVYYTDNVGNRLPDFSFCGYGGGGLAIPTNIPVQQTLSPVSGDNTANIQNAINAVSALAPNAAGFRGVILLSPGTYQIAGMLNISASGVVLRGSGNNTNTGTVLLVTGDARNVLTLGGSGSWSQTGQTYDVLDPYVPLGATNFHIGSPAGVVWGTNVTITGDADVFTNGTLLYAYDWADSNVTVNGIGFVGVSGATAGTNVTVSGIGSNYRSYSSSAAPFANLSPEYREILVGGEYGGEATATVTLENLTVGHDYAVQVWVSDPRGGSVAGRSENFMGSNAVTLAYNVPAATGGVGQWSIGVFNAASSNQTFTITSSSSTQLNALLLSDVTQTGYDPVNPPPSPPISLAAGDTIIVQRPWTQPWIDAIGMNLLSNPWTPGTGLQFERQVVAINSNQITIDAPLCNPIESAWTTGLVYQVTDSARIQQVGLENFCAVGQIADYPSNILTGVFANFVNLKNSWARDILLAGWGNGITFGGGTKWCTGEDCQYENPATGTSSAAPAAYTTAGSQDLFQRCTAEGGYYHIMVTQASTPGPNAFVNFTCGGTHYNGGPHQRWAAGALHDCITMSADTEGDYTPYLAINNRGNDGSGQGWAAGFSVMYNCQVPQFQLEQPAGATNHYNWAIGGIGSADNYSDKGIYDMLGTMLNPHSLFLEQLKERLGGAAVENIGYTMFTISNWPAVQSIDPGTSTNFTVALGDPSSMSNTVALSVTGLPEGVSARFSIDSVAGAGNAVLTLTASNSVLPGNYALSVNGTTAGVTHSSGIDLTILSPQPPGFTSAILAGGGYVFSGANGLPGGIYYVLTSTNLALPLARWTPIATNVFDKSGNFSFSAALSPSAPATFFALLVH